MKPPAKSAKPDTGTVAQVPDLSDLALSPEQVSKHLTELNAAAKAAHEIADNARKTAERLDKALRNLRSAVQAMTEAAKRIEKVDGSPPSRVAGSTLKPVERHLFIDAVRMIHTEQGAILSYLFRSCRAQGDSKINPQTIRCELEGSFNFKEFDDSVDRLYTKGLIDRSARFTPICITASGKNLAEKMEALSQRNDSFSLHQASRIKLGGSFDKVLTALSSVRAPLKKAWTAEDVSKITGGELRPSTAASTLAGSVRYRSKNYIERPVPGQYKLTPEGLEVAKALVVLKELLGYGEPS